MTSSYSNAFRKTGMRVVTESEPPEPTGFHHHVSDRQLAAFQAATPDERLRWLEETRELMWELAPEESKHWWRKLRGKTN